MEFLNKVYAKAVDQVSPNAGETFLKLKSTGEVVKATAISWSELSDISVFSRTVAGAVPAPGGTGTTRYLREDGTWQVIASGGGTWGSITGTLSDQTDLQNALNAKQAVGNYAFANGSNASGTWGINVSGASGWTNILAASGSLLSQGGDGTVTYSYALGTATVGLFPATDNSNSILTLNRHPGSYYSQLGFSSNGSLYYRRFSAVAINNTDPWQTLWTSGNLDPSTYVTLSGTQYITGAKFFGDSTHWFVGIGNLANQRADARVEDGVASRLHWYGETSSGATSNFRHAWFDGFSYVNITVASNTVAFTGNLQASNFYGNASTASTFSTNRGSYMGVTNDAVSGQLMWKAYGNNHTIFDASASTTPSGTSCSNSNPANVWSPAYPTLMGWNGDSTYGVRVDSARISDNTSGNAASATVLQTARTINGIPFNGSSNIETTEWFHSDRDFPNGTLITTSINYAVSEGDPWVLEIKGNAYGSLYPFDIQVQGYIYANTTINIGGYSNGTGILGLVALNVGGNLCFWFPNQSYWHGYNVRVYTAQGSRAVNKVITVLNQAKPAGTKEINLSAVIAQSLHSANFNNYSPTLTGGGASGNWGINITGSVITTGDASIQTNENGTTSAWRSRILSRNSTANRAAFLGIYGSNAGVFAHNNALGAWEDLYVNTVNGTTGGIVRLPNTVLIAGNQAIHAGEVAENGASKIPRYASNGYLHVDNWIRLKANTGLFSAETTHYFYHNPSSGYSGWALRSNSSNHSALVFQQSGGTVLGAIYTDTSGNMGFTNPAQTSWLWQINSSGALVSGTVPWSRLSGIPSTFNPSAHNHYDIHTRSTTTVNVGIENSESCVAYVSNSLFGQSDGALYSHVYSSVWKHQIQGDYRTGQIAIRGKNNGTWQAWRTVIDSSNFSSYLTNSRTSSSTTIGLNASGMNDHRVSGDHDGRYVRRDSSPNTVSDIWVGPRTSLPASPNANVLYFTY